MKFIHSERGGEEYLLASSCRPIDVTPERGVDDWLFAVVCSWSAIVIRFDAIFFIGTLLKGMRIV